MMQKKMSKGMLMAALICGSISVLNVASAEEMQTFEMDEFVVTASRVATSKVDTPANISVVTAETLAEKNYSDITEALADVPGVNMLGSGGKGTVNGEDYIMINGDKRVLVLIDGRRVNLGSSGTAGANFLPPVEAVERVEVLKGGGSALYGTDAVGGVINIITKKGSDVGNKITLRAVGGSWGTEEYGLTASGSNENGLGVFIAASKERRGNFDYKNQHGDVVELKNSGYNTEGINLKLDQVIGDDDRITFAFDHINSEGGAPFGTPVYSLSEKFDRLNNNVSLRYDWNETDNNQGYIQIYRNHQHAHFYSPKSENINDFIDETTGFEAQQNIKFNDSNEITVGVAYYKTEVENITEYKGKRSINNKAVFIEDRWKLNDTWQINTGVRYDRHNEFGSEVTPKVALNKKLNDDSNVYLSWGKVFNAPTTDELYYQNATMKGNPDLQAEKGDVWTLGGNTKLGEKTNLSASVFYSEIDNAIDWYYTGDLSTIPDGYGGYLKITSYKNNNKEKRRGLEISVDHEFNEYLSAYASYTYAQIKQNDGNGYARDTKEKPNTYRAGLKYKNAGWTYNADLIAVSGQKVRVNDEMNMPYAGYTDSNYFVLNLGTQYKVNDNLKVFANIYNITNARYQDLGSINYYTGDAAYPMPSRSFIIGAEYTF